MDAFRALVSYQDTLNSNLAFDAYYRGHEAGSYHAWNHAGKTGHPPSWPKGEDPPEVWDPAMERDEEELEVIAKKCGEFLPGILDRLEREVVAQAFTVWVGYEAFCEESAGVPADKLAAVVLAPVMEQIEALERRAESLGVEPEAETVEEIRQGLAEAWRMAERRGI